MRPADRVSSGGRRHEEPLCSFLPLCTIPMSASEKLVLFATSEAPGVPVISTEMLRPGIGLKSRHYPSQSSSKGLSKGEKSFLPFLRRMRCRRISVRPFRRCQTGIWISNQLLHAKHFPVPSAMIVQFTYSRLHRKVCLFNRQL
jgi:hypothetical protein